LPESSGSRERALDLFERRFGVAHDELAAFTFIERQDEIWACRTMPPGTLTSERPPGLRALRRYKDDLKPTSAFLMALGHRITAARADLTARDLQQVLLGQRIPSPATLSDGYVAICYQGDVLGCGRVRSEQLQALIPTGRRRELLGVLAANAESESANL